MVTAVAPFTPATEMVLGTARRVGDHAPGHAGLGNLDDSALMAAVSAGDGAALDQLYVRYRRVAFTAAYALLQNRSDAEDAVHDAFLSVWRAASSFQPAHGSPRAWLLTIVRNAAIDSLRARQLAQRQQTSTLLPDVFAKSDDVAASAAMAADARRLRTALTALPSPQRYAVELAFFAGLTHGQIAERTGVPLGTIKGRVRLGLRRLRQDLDESSRASSLPAACRQTSPE